MCCFPLRCCMRKFTIHLLPVRSYQTGERRSCSLPLLVKVISFGARPSRVAASFVLQYHSRILRDLPYENPCYLIVHTANATSGGDMTLAGKWNSSAHHSHQCLLLPLATAPITPPSRGAMIQNLVPTTNLHYSLQRPEPSPNAPPPTTNLSGSGTLKATHLPS